MSKALKRYSMPNDWNFPRKTRTWIIKPLAGPHPIQMGLPLQLVLRDMLKLTATAKETRTVLNEGKVLVDKKARKEPGFPVGLMDVIEVPEIKKHYRLVMGRKGLCIGSIKPEEASSKLCRIEGKRNIKGNMFQLNVHGGRNILVKDAKDYKPGDSVLLQIPEQKVLKHIKLAKGADGLIICGRNKGISGRIKEINARKNMLEKGTVIIESKEGDILTPLSYVMVTDGVSHGQIVHTEERHAEHKAAKKGGKE